MSQAITAKVNALNEASGSIMNGLSDERKTELTSIVLNTKVKIYESLLKFLEENKGFDGWYDMFVEINGSSPLGKIPEFATIEEQFLELKKYDKEDFRHYYDTEVFPGIMFLDKAYIMAEKAVAEERLKKM